MTTFSANALLHTTYGNAGNSENAGYLCVFSTLDRYMLFFMDRHGILSKVTLKEETHASNGGNILYSRRGCYHPQSQRGDSDQMAANEEASRLQTRVWRLAHKRKQSPYLYRGARKAARQGIITPKNTFGLPELWRAKDSP